MEVSWLRCTITPGQFSTEYAVTCRQANNNEFSLFAPEKDVKCDATPTLQEPADGWLRVDVWEQRGNRCLVKLPRPSFESGQFVTVNASQLNQTDTAGTAPK